jgi:hypothetical protein
MEEQIMTKSSVNVQVFSILLYSFNQLGLKQRSDIIQSSIQKSSEEYTSEDSFKPYGVEKKLATCFTK